MWSLKSNKWNTLSVFFGDPAELPVHITRWQESLGTVDEEDAYANFYDRFLHQATIADAAFAVAPFIVDALNRKHSRLLSNYVIDLGLIEANRQSPGSPAIPNGLEHEYEEAIRRAQIHAVELLSIERPKPDFRYLLCAIAGLFGHPDLAFLLFYFDAISAECPKCGQQVYPEEIQESGY